MAPENASATALLAAFAAGTRFDALPESVRHTATRMVLDATGCAIAGAANPDLASIAAYLDATAGRGEVPTPLGRRVDLPWASLAVAVATHLLDYDDNDFVAGGHPSATLVPAVLSVGYVRHSTGTEAVRAMAVGAEVEMRIGAAISPAHYSIGWHPTSALGTFGACAAAGVLLGLDARAMARAFGIAAAHSGGTKANFGTLAKSLQAGIAARGGVEAALLARADAGGNDHILDEQFGGFCELFTSAVDRSKIGQRLGEGYLMVDPGIGFKLLPCCGSVQAGVWGVIDLMREHRPDPTRIRAIRCGEDPQRIPHTDRAVVRNGLEGKFSGQYCLAVAALKGSLGLADFEDEAVLEPERQAMMKRVQLYAAPDAGTWFDATASATGSRAALVEIEMAEGTVYRTFSRGPRGYPTIPASDADLVEKFLDCASPTLGPKAARSLADDLLRLEEVPDVAPLVERAWTLPSPPGGKRL